MKADPPSTGGRPASPPRQALKVTGNAFHSGKDRYWRVSPAPLRRKRPGTEEVEDCDCCAKDCECADCERCSEEAVEVAKDWIPPPAKGKPRKGAS